MYYTYVLQSIKDKSLYTGFTRDLKKRVNKHNSGGTKSTKLKLPIKLIYYEACTNRADAIHRETYLKTAWGKKFLKNRLKYYFKGKIAQLT